MVMPAPLVCPGPAVPVSSSQAALVIIEAGDELYGGGTAAGRRVHLPWGNNAFDIHLLGAHGETLLQRAIEWAAGFDS